MEKYPLHTELSKKTLSELAELYKNKKVFEIALGDKLTVEIGGRSITEYVVTVVGSEKGEGDTIELSCGHKKIVISKK